MATYYWVGGSGDFNDYSYTHWSLTSGGAPTAMIPGSTDDVVFDANGGVGTCTFPVGIVVNSFTCNNNSISFNGGVGYELRVRGTLSLAQANKVNIQSYFEGTNFALWLEAPTAGSYTISTNTLTITRIYISPTSSSTQYYLTSFNSPGTPGYVAAKRLDLLSGNVYFGYNYTYSYRFGDVSTTTQHTAIQASSTASISTSSSNPAVTVTAYGDVIFGNRQSPVFFAASTVLEFRGSATPRNLTFNWSSGTPADVPLSKIVNYTGEDISGASVGSGVTLQISGAAIQVDQITCTTAGSVSGNYQRGISFPSTYQTTFTNVYTTPLVAVGNATYQVTLTAEVSGNANTYADSGGASNGILRVYYCTLSRMGSAPTGQYLAYTSDGNVDGMFNNPYWVFTPANASGFLMFFN